jgi:hypothetical protein
MRNLRWTAVVLGVAALAGAVAVEAPKTSPPQGERVVLENERVRVVEYTSRPGGGICGSGTHSHPAHVTIVIEPARERFAAVGGKAEEGDLKVGDVFWSEGETHTDVNVGTSGSRVMVVELK